MSLVSAIARRTFADARIRTISFAYLFVAVAYVNPVAYRHTYTTLEQRMAIAHSFGSNKAVVLFYGKAYDLLTVGGYTAWRSGGTLAIFAAVFGLLATVRALRTEEDSGRAELVLAAPVSRRTLYLGYGIAIAAGGLLLWLAEFAGLLIAKLPSGQSAYLALATVSLVPVFAAVGALASQLAPTRRIALELGGGIVALCFVLRVIADTSSSLSWIRWATPLGWAEELRPFTGGQPVVLVLPLLGCLLLFALSARLALTRDVGTGIMRARDSAEPDMRMLASPTSFAFRQERASLGVWLASVGAFAVIIGVISKAITPALVSKQLDQQLAKLGAGSVLTPKGYIGFAFNFFVVVLSLFVCAQVGAARHEEADERLETLLALPVARRAWLGGRLGLSAAGAVVIALAAGALTWAGAVAAGVSLSFPRMLEAGANTLPVTGLFLGLAALAYAIVPRASAGIAYGLVVVAFLWQLFGSLLGAPKWLVDATPFAHVGYVPAQPFRVIAALTMIAVGAAATAAAVWRFGRRDLLGA